MSRERFFLYGFVGAFVWCTYHPYITPDAALMIDRVDFLPGYLFTALSTFSWVSARALAGSPHGLVLIVPRQVTWIAPKNGMLAALTLTTLLSNDYPLSLFPQSYVLFRPSCFGSYSLPFYPSESQSIVWLYVWVRLVALHWPSLVAY